MEIHDLIVMGGFKISFWQRVQYRTECGNLHTQTHKHAKCRTRTTLRNQRNRTFFRLCDDWHRLWPRKLRIQGAIHAWDTWLEWSPHFEIAFWVVLGWASESRIFASVSAADAAANCLVCLKHFSRTISSIYIIYRILLYIYTNGYYGMIIPLLLELAFKRIRSWANLCLKMYSKWTLAQRNFLATRHCE